MDATMTPEQKAARIKELTSPGGKIIGMIIHRQMLLPTPDNMSGRQLAEEYVNEYVEKLLAEERERCAKIAEEMLPGYKGRLIEAFDKIAAEIRSGNRTNEGGNNG